MDLVGAAAGLVPEGQPLMADANQAWSLDQALAFVRDDRMPRLAWLEEPIAADSSAAEWALLASEAPVPLAAGENMAGLPEFDAAIASRSFGDGGGRMPGNRRSRRREVCIGCRP